MTFYRVPTTSTRWTGGDKPREVGRRDQRPDDPTLPNRKGGKQSAHPGLTPDSIPNRDSGSRPYRPDPMLNRVQRSDPKDVPTVVSTAYRLPTSMVGNPVAAPVRAQGDIPAYQASPKPTRIQVTLSGAEVRTAIELMGPRSPLGLSEDDALMAYARNKLK